MSQTFILDFDDLEFAKPGLEELIKLKEHYPKLKVTCFMTPIPEVILKEAHTPKEYQDWANELKKLDWIEICPHGITHQGPEMLMMEENGKMALVDKKTAKSYLEAVEHTFKQLGLKYKKIWKSPHWQTSPGAYKVLWKRGYKVACDPNEAHPDDAYLYDWSIDTPIPLRPVVKGHGHLTPNNSNYIRRCIRNLVKIPTDAEFLWVSEAIERGL